MGRFTMVVLCVAALVMSASCASSERHEKHVGMMAQKGPMDQHGRGMMDQKGPGDQPARGPMVQRPMMPMMGMMTSDAAKAEMKRHMTALEDLHKQTATLREAVAKDIKGGAAADKAGQAHMDEAKALAKKMMSEMAMHMTNMGKAIEADANTPATVDKMAEGLVKPMMMRHREMMKPDDKKPVEKKAVEEKPKSDG